MPWIKDENGRDILVPEGGFDYFRKNKSVPTQGSAFGVSGGIPANVPGEETSGWTQDVNGNHVLIPAGGFDYFKKKATIPNLPPETLPGGAVPAPATSEPVFNTSMPSGPVNIDVRTGKPTRSVMPTSQPGTQEPFIINNPSLPGNAVPTIEDVVHAQDPLLVSPGSQTAAQRAMQSATVPGLIQKPLEALGETDTFKSLIAGMYSNIPMYYGGGMEWLGDKFDVDTLSGKGKNIREFGETTAERYADPDWAQPIEFESWGQALTDPRFYTRNVMRNVPLMASLLIPTVLGAEAGGLVAGAAGWSKLGSLGKWGTKLLRVIGGLSGGVPLESALEAGGVYTEAKNRGLSEEEAMQAADDAFTKNAALLSVTNLPELAAMFSPAPKWLVKMLGTAADSKLGRAAVGAGRIGMAGVSEGLEEGAQEVIQRSSLGDEISFDPAMQESIAQGLVLGGGPGIIGALQHEMQTRAYGKASKEAKKFLETAVDEKVKAGVSVEEAVKQVFDEFAGTEEGDKVVGESMQEVLQDVADVERVAAEKQKSRQEGQQPEGQQAQPVIQPVQKPVQQTQEPVQPVQQPEIQPIQEPVSVQAEPEPVTGSTVKPVETGQKPIEKPVKEPVKYGKRGNRVLKKLAQVSGLDLSDPDNSDVADLIDFFETYYSAGLEGRNIPEITMHPQDANEAYNAGRLDNEGQPEEPTKQPAKYGRIGNNVFKKWANNEYVMADLDKSDDPYVQAYRQFFEKWYQAGKEGIRTIDVPFDQEIDSQFPHFLTQLFYQAGSADVRAQPSKEVSVQPEIQKAKELETKSVEQVKTVDEAQKPKKSTNIGYHAGDLGKAEHLARFHGSNRGTGHFGTGTYFVGSKEAVNLGNYKDRPVQEINFDGYNLYRPDGHNQANNLHEGLKFINDSTNFYKPGMTLEQLLEAQAKGKDDYRAEAFQNRFKDLYSLFYRDFGIEEFSPYRKGQEFFEKALIPILDEIYNEVSGSGLKWAYEKADSASTRFMKKLGYEGVDVRGIKGFDNTQYGSVIYDLRVEQEEVAKIGETEVQSKQEEPVVEESKPEERATPSRKVAIAVKDILVQGQKFTSAELFKIADQFFEGTQAEKKYTSKDAYDALELGVNLYLLEHKKSVGPMVSAEQAKRILESIRQEILEVIPTQTKRTEEQDRLQQFSTPPNIAYIAAWVANISSRDVALEPSAGIGGLAVFAKSAGAKEVIVNEFSPRRAEVLKEMGFDRVFTENAEQLNNVLPKDIKPTVIIMNPPFSSTARIRSKNDTKNAILHIEQALKKLAPGGRLVAIVGQGMSDSAANFKGWWNKLRETYNIRANIVINGKNYTKYGTNFGVQLVVIDKTGPLPKGVNSTVVKSVDLLEDALPLLEGIKNDRITSENRQTQQATDKPVGEKPAEQGRPETGPEPAVPVSTDQLGTTDREGGAEQPGEQERIPRSETTSGKTPVSHEPGTGNEPSDQGRPGSGEPAGSVGQSQEAGQEDTAGSSGVPDGKTDVRTPAEAAKEPGSGTVKTTKTEIEVKSEKTKTTNQELTDAVFTDYAPQKLKITGAKQHPGALAQSAAMAAVEPPTPTYTPNLPKEIISEGKLSLAQLESVVYAGQSHQQTLPDGTRKGFFIGDGTGVGKGREISGIILDNIRQGRKKAVWISKNGILFEDAQRDFGDIGGDKNTVFEFNKIKMGTPVKQKDGVLFTTYDTLGQGLSSSNTGELIVKEGKSARIDQVINWLGKDFDGVIVFDEAHQMQNSITQKGKRGAKKPSTRALAGIELQKRLPNARIVYVSATGATEVSNLAYADRLGLWGEGTPFANKLDFIDKVQAGGLAAMELVARDMKAMGAYIARNLSYDGVTYGTLEHNLTPEQTEIYDEMAKAWQIVLQNVNKALEETGQGKDGHSKGRAIGQFWGAQQRFFNQVLTSVQMPSVVEQVKKDLANGNAVVMQLVNTNEAAQNRAISKMNEEDSLEDLDLTPRDMLMQYLDKSFPIQQYEEYEDDNGNIRSRPVVDSHGNPVINQEAMEMKEDLLSKLGALKVPEGPLEIILNEFGTEMVAEVTGRTRRVVRESDDGGRTKAKLESRTPKHASADAQAFLDDKKKILVFSDAGGTGRSYHASLKEKNQRRRIHYLIQAGWRADNAVQGFGRTHRTNQANAPHYILVTTNLKGQKRFISSIARRLDQLGALTKGQRQTGSQGLFSAKDNLESDLARDALQQFYEDLARELIEGVTAKELLSKMGLSKMLDENRNVSNENPDLRDITKFLNRILALESTLQNKIFEEFTERLDAKVEKAIADGTLDVGLENYRADKVVVSEEKSVFVDESSGAETKYFALEAYHKNKKVSFENASRLPKLKGFYRNTKSDRVYAVKRYGHRTLTSGSVVEIYQVQGQAQSSSHNITRPDFEKGNWEEIPESEAEKAWNEALEKVPEFRIDKVNLISGALLPIWDRLPTGHVRVIRVKTEDGRMLLGRIVPEKAIDLTLKKLGANRVKQEVSPAEIADKILNENYTVYLSNEWKLVKRRVSGENRIEIIGRDLYTHMGQLRNEGVFTERINWDTRFFIPTGEEAARVIEKVTKYRPVVDMVSPDASGEFSLAAKKKKSKKKKSKKPAPTIDKELTDPNELITRAENISPKAARKMGEKLAQLLNTVLRSGRHTRGTEGSFSKKSKTGKIRKPKTENWRVMGHELAHGISFILLDEAKFKPRKSEMWDIAEEMYPGQIPEGQKTQEGLAEYLMLWFSDNKTAREMAPVTSELFDEFLDNNPQIGTQFDEILAIAELDLEGDILAQMANLIAKPGERVKVNIGDEYAVPWFKKLQFQLADFTIPLKDLYRAAVEQGFEGLDPAKLAAVSGSAREKATNLFSGSARDEAGRFLLPGKRSLREIVEDAAQIPHGVQLMDWIYHAMRYQERYKVMEESKGTKQFELPKTKAYFDEVVEQARDRYPEMVKLVEEYAEILSEINLRLLVRGEVISEEDADYIRAGSKYYLPLYHVGEQEYHGSGNNRRASGEGVRRFKGHEGQTMNFIEASIIRLNDTVLAVEIERLMQSIEGALRQPNMGLFGDFIQAPIKSVSVSAEDIVKHLNGEISIEDEERVIRMFIPGGLRDISQRETILMARHGGRHVYMRVAPDIYRAALSMKPITVDIVAKTLAYLTQIGRFGALANIRYITNAVMRDIIVSKIQSKAGMGERSLIADFIKGVATAVGMNPEVMDMYIQSGGYGSSPQEVINGVLRASVSDGLMATPVPGWKRTATGALVRVVTSPLEALRILEEMPRLAEFEAVLKRDLEPLGVSYEDFMAGDVPDELAPDVEKALLEAAYASREILVNFGLHGIHEGFRKYARTVQFMQGSIQGVYRFGRQIKDKLYTTLMRMAIYMAPLTILAWMLSADDDKYKDMPSESRDRYWWFPVPGAKDFRIALAKPYEYALPANMLERFLDWASNNDPNSRKLLSDFRTAVKTSFGIPMTSMLVDTIISLYSGKNSFGSPIEPEREQNLLPQERYGTGTSKFAINMAKVVGAVTEKGPSPRVIDYFMKNSFGGIGKTVTNILSNPLNPLKWLKGDDRPGVEYWPVIGSLIYGSGEGGSRIVDRFYEDKTRAEQLYKSSGLWRKQWEDQARAKGLSPEETANFVNENLRKRLKEEDVRLILSIPVRNMFAKEMSDMRAAQRDMAKRTDISPEQKKIFNLRMSYLQKLAAGYLYQRPIPEAPPEAELTDVQIQDMLKYYDYKVQRAITNALKTKGGPV